MNANTEDNCIHGISQQQSEVHGDKVQKTTGNAEIIFTKALMSRKG